MARTEPVDLARVDLVSLAHSLRAGGAPVTSDDIGDAARGLARLGSADPELVAAVLDATIGKYGPPGSPAVPDSSTDRGVTTTAGDAPPSIEFATGGGAAMAGDDDDSVSITIAADQARRPSSRHAAGEAIWADVTPAVAALGVQTFQPGSAREASVELVGTGPPPRVDPTELITQAPRAWVLPSRRSPIPARTSLDAAPDGRELAASVRSFAAHLDGGSSRRRPARAGSIDLHRTFVRSRRTGGRLLPPARRRRGRRRPAVTLVVDMSPSVRGTTSLPIAMAHRLARTSRRVRVFAATDRLTEVTAAFRGREPGPGLERAVAAAELDPAASSDWGRVLHELDQCAGATGPRVHVVVLGDGRSVGAADGVVALERIVRRVASVRWATPEPRGAWALGSGEPARYSEIVAVMATLRMAADLVGLSCDRSPLARSENHS